MTVRTDANLNYPFILKRGAVTIGHVQVGSWPEQTKAAVELTGHDSAGEDESMPDGINRKAAIKLTMISTTANIHDIRADYDANTVTTWTISDSVDACTFEGWVSRLKKMDADGAKPDAIKWEIDLQPTGALTWVPS